MIPGRARGSTTCRSAPVRVHPSTRALSSTSRGIVVKYAVSIQVANGTMKAG